MKLIISCFTIAYCLFKNLYFGGFELMNSMNFSKNEEHIWSEFVQQFHLSGEQESKFKKYLSTLLEENKKINLTTITSVQGIIEDHFTDSLMLSKFVDFKNINSLCDIGAGAGFPGIPLKILYPHLHLVLIEVVQKKIRFLENIISELDLESAEVYPFDWRTFLRKTDYEIDLFCARASLQPKELIRMFKPVCPYKNAQLVYLAATGWEPDEKVASFVKKQEKYKVGNKKRKFVFLGF